MFSIPHGDGNENPPYYIAFYWGNEQGYIDDISVSVKVSPAAPFVLIETDKTEYTTGDTMLVDITIGNPTSVTQNVVLNWWITIPSENFYTAPLVVRPMSLPVGYNITFRYPITVDTGVLRVLVPFFVPLSQTRQREKS